MLNLRLWAGVLFDRYFLYDPQRFCLSCNLVPYVCVDAQVMGQPQNGRGAGGPAAQWAAGGVEDVTPVAHLLQADRAEGVVAVQDSGEPRSATVAVTADGTNQVLLGGHAGFRKMRHLERKNIKSAQ